MNPEKLETKNGCLGHRFVFVLDSKRADGKPYDEACKLCYEVRDKFRHTVGAHFVTQIGGVSQDWAGLKGDLVTRSVFNFAARHHHDIPWEVEKFNVLLANFVTDVADWFDKNPVTIRIKIEQRIYSTYSEAMEFWSTAGLFKLAEYKLLEKRKEIK